MKITDVDERATDAPSRRQRTRDVSGLIGRMTPEELRDLIRDLTDAQKSEWLRRWYGYENPGQCAPEGDWRVWLIQAGRGFGKTRAGAEWVSQVARDVPGAQIALVAATIADGQRVMIEGPSGLIAVQRDHEAICWSAGRRELRFPSGAVATLYSAEAGEELRGELAEGFAGGANAGRPLLLEGGLKWQALSLSPAEMDFLELKASAAREIAMVFGVPPMLLGLRGDATYANYKEANRALWRLTVLPLAGKILAGIGQGLRGWFPGAELRVDLNKVSALAEERMTLWREVSRADWLTAEEKKALLGVGSAE